MWWKWLLLLLIFLAQLPFLKLFFVEKAKQAKELRSVYNLKAGLLVLMLTGLLCISLCLFLPFGDQYSLGLTLDKAGNSYLIEQDTFSTHIQKFDPNGHLILFFGNSGDGDGEFNKPTGIASDNENNIYVADGENSCIQKFNEKGFFLKKICYPGEQLGEFGYLAGIAVNKKGHIFAADGRNDRIQEFDNTGSFIQSWGSSGRKEGQFGQLASISADGNDNIYASDYRNRRIEKFDPYGRFLIQWGKEGYADENFMFLGKITVDAQGNNYIVDRDKSEIKKFDSNGQFLLKWGGAGSEAGKFSENIGVGGIATDLQGNVYVADYDSDHRGRIQKFDEKGLLLTQWSTFSLPNWFDKIFWLTTICAVILSYKLKREPR